MGSLSDDVTSRVQEETFRSGTPPQDDLLITATRHIPLEKYQSHEKK